MARARALPVPRIACVLVPHLAVQAIDGYQALDGFSDETGVVNPNMPRSRWDVSFTDAKAGTLVTTVVQYNSPEDVQKVIDMGMKEGMASTLERLDELLVDIGAEEAPAAT